jgi:hypothetical protein
VLGWREGCAYGATGQGPANNITNPRFVRAAFQLPNMVTKRILVDDCRVVSRPGAGLHAFNVIPPSDAAFSHKRDYLGGGCVGWQGLPCNSNATL